MKELPKKVFNASQEELKEAEKHKDDKKSFTSKRHFPLDKNKEYIIHRSHFQKTGGVVVVEFKSGRGSKVIKRWNIKPTKQ